MPKTQNRFRVFFDGFAGLEQKTALTKFVSSCEQPAVVFDPEARTSVWSDVVVTLRDTVQNDVARAVGKQMLRQQVDLDRSRFALVIELMDGSDGVLARWDLADCVVVKVSPSALDYSSAEPVLVGIHIRPTTVRLSGTMF